MQKLQQQRKCGRKCMNCCDRSQHERRAHCMMCSIPRWNSHVRHITPPGKRRPMTTPHPGYPLFAGGCGEIKRFADAKLAAVEILRRRVYELLWSLTEWKKSVRGMALLATVIYALFLQESSTHPATHHLPDFARRSGHSTHWYRKLLWGYYHHAGKGTHE